MDLYQSTRGLPFPSRQDPIFNAIVAYGYFAPYKLAWDEAHARMLDDGTLSQRLAAAASGATRRPLLEGVRRRLGEILMLIGTRLQGTAPVAAGVSASPVTVSAGSRL